MPTDKKDLKNLEREHEKAVRKAFDAFEKADNDEEKDAAEKALKEAETNLESVKEALRNA